MINLTLPPKQCLLAVECITSLLSRPVRLPELCLLLLRAGTFLPSLGSGGSGSRTSKRPGAQLLCQHCLSPPPPRPSYLPGSSLAPYLQEMNLQVYSWCEEERYITCLAAQFLPPATPASPER